MKCGRSDIYQRQNKNSVQKNQKIIETKHKATQRLDETTNKNYFQPITKYLRLNSWLGNNE